MKNAIVQLLLFCILLFSLTGCSTSNNVNNNNAVIAFGTPVKVTINGYSGNTMEPFLSRDGSILLFNNLNSAPENTNLHWATRINDSSFEYKGEIAGINTADLEAVPSLDKAGNLYFVSTRNYATALSTIYQGNFSNGVATNVNLVNGISKLQAGWVNFDVEVTEDGQTLYFVDAQFDQSGVPLSADLIIAGKSSNGFQRLPGAAAIMQNINTNALEYAACISADELEL